MRFESLSATNLVVLSSCSARYFKVEGSGTLERISIPSGESSLFGRAFVV